MPLMAPIIHYFNLIHLLGTWMTWFDEFHLVTIGEYWRIIEFLVFEYYDFLILTFKFE